MVGALGVDVHPGSPAARGWTPPPGWQPDPASGPPPPDWPVWVSYRANPRAFAWSFGFAAGFYLLILVASVISNLGRASGG